MHDVQSDYHSREDYDAQITAQLLAFQRYGGLSGDYQEKQVEVDAEQQHEHRDHDVYVRAVIVSHAQRAQGKAARSRGAHRVYDRIEKRHSAEEQKHRFEHREGDIYHVEYQRGFAYARHELAHRRSRHLRAQYAHASRVCHRQHRHDEHQHSHSADPVRKAAPEDAASRHALDIGEYGRSRGREAGDRFEYRVDEVGYLSAEYEGQSAEKRHRYPRQRHAEKALLREDPGVDGLKQQQPPARGGEQQYHGEEMKRGLSVYYTYQRGQKHEGGFRAQDPAQDLPYGSVIQKQYHAFSVHFSVNISTLV